MALSPGDKLGPTKSSRNSLPLGPPRLRRGSRLVRKGDRPARSDQFHVAVVPVWSRTAYLSARGRADAEAQSAGLVITTGRLRQEDVMRRRGSRLRDGTLRAWAAATVVLVLATIMAGRLIARQPAAPDPVAAR